MTFFLWFLLITTYIIFMIIGIKMVKGVSTEINDDTTGKDTNNNNV